MSMWKTAIEYWPPPLSTHKTVVNKAQIRKCNGFLIGKTAVFSPVSFSPQAHIIISLQLNVQSKGLEVISLGNSMPLCTSDFCDLNRTSGPELFHLSNRYNNEKHLSPTRVLLALLKKKKNHFKVHKMKVLLLLNM